MPAPIIRKIPGLEKRIVGVTQNNSKQNIHKNLLNGIGGLHIGHDFGVATTQTFTLGDNLVPNGDMELNSDWITWGDSINVQQSNTQAHNGSYSWQFTITSKSDGISMENAMTINPGSIYKLSFWAYIEDVTNGIKWAQTSGFGGTVISSNFPNSTLGNTYWGTIIPTNTWTYIELDILATVSTPAIKFANGGAWYNNSVNTTYYIDDVTYKEKIPTNLNQNIRKLFDSDTKTETTIKHNNKQQNWIIFDLGKNRTIDRLILTNGKRPNGAANVSLGLDLDFYLWTADQNPKTDTATLIDWWVPTGGFNHNSATPLIKRVFANTSQISQANTPGTGTKQQFQYIGIKINKNFSNGYNGGLFNFENLEIYESFDTRDYSVEFNDSVLDMQSWAGPRYKGCKTTGKKINEFHPSSSVYSGDVTFGKSPNVENKTTALYITNTIIGGTEEEDQFTRIKHHSYIGIDKILIINLEDDTVKILDRETEDFEPFHRFVTTDFPTSGKFNIKVLDNYIQNNLKSEYRVKMNKGWLLRSFSYNATDGPLPGMNENNSEELTGKQLDSNGEDYDSNVKYTIANSLSLYDFVSGSVQRPDQIYGYNDELNPFNNVGLYGCQDEAQPCAGSDPGITDEITNLYQVFSNGPLYGTINYTNALDTNYAYPGSEVYDSTYTQHAGGELRFRFGVTSKIDNENTQTGTPRASFYPFYSGDNTRFTDNKFTRKFILQENDSQVAVKNFNFPTIQDIKNTQVQLSFGGADGILKSNTLNPSVTASLFIGQCVQYLNNNPTETELHLTLFEGTKDFSNNNDEMSISTFEVDRNVNAGYLDFAENLGALYNTVGPRAKYLKLKNQPKFKPSISLTDRGNNRYVYDLIETSLYQAIISERQNSFVFGPGTPHQNLDAYGGWLRSTTALSNYGGDPPNNLVERYDNSTGNSGNFSGSFQYELSFLDKDHTLIADIDKNAELFDGIGGAGAVLIPEHTHEAVKINLYYYLEKAGMINRTTKKKRIPPI